MCPDLPRLYIGHGGFPSRLVANSERLIPIFSRIFMASFRAAWSAGISIRISAKEPLLPIAMSPCEGTRFNCRVSFLPPKKPGNFPGKHRCLIYSLAPSRLSTGNLKRVGNGGGREFCWNNKKLRKPESYPGWPKSRHNFCHRTGGKHPEAVTRRPRMPTPAPAFTL